MGTLLNIQTGYTDRSGVLYNTAKHLEMPEGWFETDGYQEEATFNDRSATRIFVGPWGSRIAFQRWALGSCYLDSSVLKRDPPAQHPELPWLYCRACSRVAGQGSYRESAQVVNPTNGSPLGMIEYYDGGGAAAGLLSCRLALEYGLPGYDVLTDDEVHAQEKTEVDRYVVKEANSSLQALTIPGQQLQFGDGPFAGQSISQTGQILLLPTEELTYTWVNVPKIPQAAIDACLGCVNAATFDPNSRLKPGGYPAGTLLFQAPKKVPKRTSEGLWVYDLVYRYLYRPTKWNFFPAADGQFYAAYFPTSPPRLLYPTADFDSPFVLQG